MEYKRKALKFVVSKDNFIPSKPWKADIHFSDGTIWLSWSHGYKTRKSLVEHCLYCRELPVEYK